MKKIVFSLLAWATISAFLTGCHGVSPDGDEESVIVKKPWIFGSGGVDPDPISAGNTWCAISTSSVDFKITPVKYTEEFENIMTSDNIPVSFAVYITLQVKKGKTPILYQGWGENGMLTHLKQHSVL